MITQDRPRCGVVIGKFNPPHLGHLFLIETAAARVERLFVLVCDRQDQSIPATQRRRWLEEVVPASFRAKLFKCFLDAAVSEQIARMVAMKSATENASDMIKSLSTTYNRARQSQITGEIMEIIGGVEALEG